MKSSNVRLSKIQVFTNGFLNETNLLLLCFCVDAHGSTFLESISLGMNII